MQKVKSLICHLKKNWFAVCLISVAIMCIALHLIAIWAVDYIAFQDYPSYVFRAHVIKNFSNPAYQYSEYFTQHWGSAPNQLADVLISFFSLFLPVDIACKLFLSLYVLLLPLSAFYFLKMVNPSNLEYVFWTLALTFNFSAVFFFANFMISVPLFLFFIGYWHKTRDRSDARTLMANLTILGLLYYSHMISFAVALFVVASLSFFECRDLRKMFYRIRIFVPFILIFLIWTGYTFFVNSRLDPQKELILPFSSLLDRWESLREGISPMLLPENRRALYQTIFFIFSLLGVTLGVLLNTDRKMIRLWRWPLVILLIISVVLPFWFVIFYPGPRILLLTLFMSLAVFPSAKVFKYPLILVLAFFLIILRGWESRYLTESSIAIKRINAVFASSSTIPSYPAEKVLPLVFPPYSYLKGFHRVFEYYNLINGGINPYHVMSPRFCVAYKNLMPAPPQYEPFIENMTPEMLNTYDTVLVIGKDGSRADQTMRFLIANHFQEIRGDGFTGVFKRAPKLWQKLFL